jgi:hypothetical protein
LTWGSPFYHASLSRLGDHVRDQLKNVEQVHVTKEAFAAIVADGSVVTWGNGDSNGDSTRVREQLKNVQRIFATERAFAAILADEGVVAWGSSSYGGDSTSVRNQLKNVQK